MTHRQVTVGWDDFVPSSVAGPPRRLRFPAGRPFRRGCPPIPAAIRPAAPAGRGARSVTRGCVPIKQPRQSTIVERTTQTDSPIAPAMCATAVSTVTTEVHIGNDRRCVRDSFFIRQGTISNSINGNREPIRRSAPPSAALKADELDPRHRSQWLKVSSGTIGAGPIDGAGCPATRCQP